MISSKDYWAKRAAQRMYRAMEDAETVAKRIGKAYASASDRLRREAERIFTNFRLKHGLTEAEARLILNRVKDKKDLKELFRKLASADKADAQDIITELESPAYAARLARLARLQEQIDAAMLDIYKIENEQSRDFYVDLAKEGFNRSMYEIQQQAGYGFSFSHLKRKHIDTVLAEPWSGKHFSDRIWDNTHGLADELKNEMLVTLLTGRPDREAAHSIAGKFAKGYMQARRLVRTEACHVSNVMSMEAYEEAGIAKYLYVATLDLITSQICRSLDGKTFLVSKMKPGTNCPPMHPWCRSTTIAAPTAEELARMKRRARDPVTGKTYLVPASMTYEEWYEKYVEGKPEADQGGIKSDARSAKTMSAGIESKAEEKVVWPETGDKVSLDNFKMIRKYANDKGIQIAGIKNSDLDLDLVKDAIDKTAEMLEKYDIQSKIRHPFTMDFSHSLIPTDFAETYPGTKHVIYFNKDAYRSQKALDKEYKKRERVGFFVKGTTYKAIPYHEAGHIVADVYGINPLEIARKITGLNDDANILEYVTKQLSTYAGKLGGDEIIAESFSAVYSGLDNSFALKFVKECDIIIQRG